MVENLKNEDMELNIKSMESPQIKHSSIRPVRNIISRNDSVKARFAKYLEERHPCVMAKSIIMNDNLTLRTYSRMSSQMDQRILIEDLRKYVAGFQPESRNFRSFVAVFTQEEGMDEKTFESKLWKLLGSLSEIDDCEWDPSVSSDPQNEFFSFSLLGKAFYIVGLHPNSSRIARRSPQVSIVFNLHAQFEKLRNMGVYQQVRDRIRSNDKDIQGTVNPMLDDFGGSSEARQYSGREVDSDWKCPFHHKNQD